MPKRKDAPGSSKKKSPKRARSARPQNLGSRFEKKVSDIAVTQYQVNTTGSFTLLHAPVPGTDYTQRIGRKTSPKSVYIRGRCQIEAAASSVTNVNAPAQLMRMIVFHDKQPNGAAPAVTDLLNSADPASQLNLNGRDRFKVIKDETFVFDPYIVDTTVTAATTNYNKTVENINSFSMVKDVETIFNGGNAGTIADITSGALYMFWIGSNAAGTGTDGNAFVSTRVRYFDA